MGNVGIREGDKVSTFFVKRFEDFRILQNPLEFIKFVKMHQTLIDFIRIYRDLLKFFRIPHNLLQFAKVC